MQIHHSHDNVKYVTHDHFLLLPPELQETAATAVAGPAATAGHCLTPVLGVYAKCNCHAAPATHQGQEAVIVHQVVSAWSKNKGSKEVETHCPLVLTTGHIGSQGLSQSSGGWLVMQEIFGHSNMYMSEQFCTFTLQQLATFLQ